MEAIIMDNCNAKHTKIQLTDEEFKCPRCGKGPDDDGLVIEGGPEEANLSCTLMHDDDLLYCATCGYETTGKRLVARHMKKRALVTCPWCKGAGVVSAKKAKKYKE